MAVSAQMDHGNIRPVFAKSRFDARPIDAVEVEDVSKAAPESVVEAFGAAYGEMFLRAEIAFEGSREYAPDAVQRRTLYPDHQISGGKPQIEGKQCVIAVGDPGPASYGRR